MNLHLENVTKSFGVHRVLDGVSLRLGDVKSLVLIGPSGGGKSTLLRVLAGLIAPDAGRVEIGGVSVACDVAYRRTIGVVFQAFNLFPHLTALANITLPLEKAHGHSADSAREAAQLALRRFKLEAHAHKKPAELSGGQKQRIAIARAIAIQPRLLLFDEPTSALDPEMTAEVLDLIGELKDEGRDFILVTHQMGFARHVGDEVAFLENGRIAEHGSAEQLLTDPQTQSCRDFLARVLKY